MAQITVLSSTQGCTSDQQRLTGDYLHACGQQDQRSQGSSLSYAAKFMPTWHVLSLYMHFNQQIRG